MTSDAWALAHRAAEASGIELRPLPGLADAEAILSVMQATWGGHELLPREMLRALADSGNVPYGAFDGHEPIGYVLGWAGVDPDEGLHVHSHMLATIPERRHRGVGYALKLAQRAQALEQGIGVVRWTFDPLVARNAYLNIHKLGAIGDRFERNHYGVMSDAINLGERSDRFTVRWDLAREPGPHTVSATETVLARRGEGPAPIVGPAGRSALVEVPAEYGDLRQREPAIAGRWRDASAEAIERCLAARMVAAGFDGPGARYVFVTRKDLPP